MFEMGWDFLWLVPKSAAPPHGTVSAVRSTIRLREQLGLSLQPKAWITPTSSWLPGSSILGKAPMGAANIVELKEQTVSPASPYFGLHIAPVPAA